MLLLLSIVLNMTSPFVPYLDTDYAFHYNYTGAVIEGRPLIAFTSIEDSLSIDSLSNIYPTVIAVDSITFETLVDNPEEFCERFRR